MNRFLLKIVAFSLLFAACGRAARALPTALSTHAPPTLAPSPTPGIAATPIPIATTATSAALVAVKSLAVIHADNVNGLERLVTLRGHTDRVTDLVFSGDGKYLASTGYDGIIRLWELPGWQEVYTFPINEADLNVLAFSPDGRLLASGENVWDMATKERVHRFEWRLTGPAHVAFSPDGTRLVVFVNNRIAVWDCASWNEVLSFDVPTDSRWLFNIVYSPDGKYLASGSGQNGTVYIWSAESGDLVSSLAQGDEQDVHDIAYTPDGLLLATGGSDNFAHIWNVAGGEEIHKLPLIGMYSLAISPDGTLLATAGPDRSVKLWDVQSGMLLKSLAHADELMAVAFSADGRLIAAGGYDNTIVIWAVGR